MPHLSAQGATTILFCASLFFAPAALGQDRSSQDEASQEQTTQGQGGEDPLLLIDQNGFMLRGHLQAGVNGVVEHNLFWNLADLVAPGVDTDAQWLEGYIEPGLSFTLDLDNSVVLYGKVSAIASGTLGIDAFDTGNTGAITLEEGYLALRTTNQNGPTIDLSLGPRDFVAGSGMLLANGGSNGFERGALKLGPHKAWGMAALGTIGLEDVKGTAFYLEPNEQPNNETGTKIVGVDLRYDKTAQTFVGGTLGHVPESTSPYPKAAPGGIGPPELIPDGRKGLSFINLYGRGNPFDPENENFFLSGDIAYEWNPRIDMSAWGGRAQIGYTFADAPWTPTLSYTFQTFSGDNPLTSRLERFDPLYYEGSPNAWATGSKSSLVFNNSNVNAHQLALSVKPTQVDTITLRYAHIRANELGSPIQFGQGTRTIEVGGQPYQIAGVTNANLSDDFFIEYNRVLTPNAFLTAGFSISMPGEGIRSITGSDTVWSGGFVNVVVNF